MIDIVNDNVQINLLLIRIIANISEVTPVTNMSFLAQLVERVTSNDEVSCSSQLEGIFLNFD